MYLSLYDMANISTPSVAQMEAAISHRSVKKKKATGKGGQVMMEKAGQST